MHGVGHYLCTIVVLPLNVTMVQSWLPDELELAPQSITPPGTHPVNILFGDERDVHINIFPFFHIDYMEFAFVVPFVQWKHTKNAYRGPFLFTPLLFLNKELPILAGKILYGYPKRKAVITSIDEHYRVVEKGNLIISGDFQTTAQHPAQTEFDTLNSLLQQPNISQSILGPFVCAVFDWNLTPVKITARQADVDIVAGLLPNQPELKQQVSGFDFSQGAAYFLDTVWTLTMPHPCCWLR